MNVNVSIDIIRTTPASATVKVEYADRESFIVWTPSDDSAVAYDRVVTHSDRPSVHIEQRVVLSPAPGAIDRAIADYLASTLPTILAVHAAFVDEVPSDDERRAMLGLTGGA